MTDDNKDYCPIMGAWLPRRKSYRETIVQDEALCRAIEQREAYEQKVSDAVEKYKADQPYIWKHSASDYFCRFIISKFKPDPLVEVAKSLGFYNTAAQHWVDELRTALDACGLEIREKGQ